MIVITVMMIMIMIMVKNNGNFEERVNICIWVGGYGRQKLGQH